MNLPLNEVLLGDCLVVLKTLPDNSVDAIVSDPPYGLGTKQPSREDILRYLAGERLNTGGDFMGKDWEMPPVSVWKECLRVLKPGGHLLAFAGTRTFDMMSVGIKAAGFEDTDTVASMFGPSVLQWVYGAGFPKSLDISKAIAKMPERKAEDVAKWQGWGTALKPAWEPILCFRKPSGEASEPVENDGFPREDEKAIARPPTPLDRVEAHLEGQPLPDSSFYYTAKASKTDRNQGLDEMWTPGTLMLRNDVDDEAMERIYAAFPGVHREDFPDTFADVQVPGSVRKYFKQVTKGERGNMHVTVKPVALMRWLVRLVCPKDGIVLDPYSGSGTTLVAAAEEGMNFVGIELDPAYHEIARKRAVALSTKRLTTEAEQDIFAMMMGLDD